jgi:hypothetical protein
LPYRSAGSDDDDYDINWKIFLPVAELIYRIKIKFVPRYCIFKWSS